MRHVNNKIDAQAHKKETAQGDCWMRPCIAPIMTLPVEHPHTLTYPLLCPHVLLKGPPRLAMSRAPSDRGSCRLLEHGDTDPQAGDGGPPPPETAPEASRRRSGESSEGALERSHASSCHGERQEFRSGQMTCAQIWAYRTPYQLLQEKSVKQDIEIPRPDWENTVGQDAVRQTMVRQDAVKPGWGHG